MGCCRHLFSQRSANSVSTLGYPQDSGNARRATLRLGKGTFSSFISSKPILVTADVSSSYVPSCACMSVILPFLRSLFFFYYTYFPPHPLFLASSLHYFMALYYILASKEHDTWSLRFHLVNWVGLRIIEIACPSRWGMKSM